MFWSRIQSGLLRVGAAVLAAAVPAGAAIAQAASEAPANLLVHGDFESATPTLRLPAVSPYPLVAGGWGARGANPRATIRVSPVGDIVGSVLQLASRPGDPTHLLQDVPLGTDSFVLELAAQRLRGRQSVRILGEWDRMDPEIDAGIQLVLGAARLRIRTPQQSASVDWPTNRGDWIALRLISDARTGLVQLWVDGTLGATVAGRVERPRTVVLGGHAGAPSRFRYDSLQLFRLAELELAELRSSVARQLHPADARWILERLDAASAALERGSEALAAPEVRAAQRLIARARAATPRSPEPATLAVAAEALARLLAAS